VEIAWAVYTDRPEGIITIVSRTVGFTLRVGSIPSSGTTFSTILHCALSGLQESAGGRPRRRIPAAEELRHMLAVTRRLPDVVAWLMLTTR
jgi:hypothetical protein